MELYQHKFLINQKHFLCTGDKKIPIRHKRNGITGELHGAKRITSSFNKEMDRNKKKYRNTEFPYLKFVNETVRNFGKENEEIVIPEWLFDQRKTFRVGLPCSPTNEKFSNLFTKKIGFTNGR